jgi:hypothetical protein
MLVQEMGKKERKKIDTVHAIRQRKIRMIKELVKELSLTGLTLCPAQMIQD